MATMIPATRYPKPNSAGMPTPPRAHIKKPGPLLFLVPLGDSYRQREEGRRKKEKGEKKMPRTLFLYAGRLGLDQPAADGIPDQARGLVDIQLFHDPGAVRFCGLY